MVISLSDYSLTQLTGFSIGQQFAITEASFTIIRILQAFKAIEPRDNSNGEELMTVTMAVRGGVHVGLTPA
jgi:hypothetical protein